MTKKHFKAIAEIIKDNALSESQEQIPDHDAQIRVNTTLVVGKWIACALADYFADENPLFSRSKFLSACGLESEG